jgi:hypothetical protein
MTIIYPAGIDNNSTLPSAVDSFTEFNEEYINRYRDAIIAIEQELGVKPSGTYATVRARLDALEASAGSGGISVNGDLGLSSIPVPGTIRVIGLQGFPIASLPPISGQVLGWSGSVWEPLTVPGLGVFTINMYGQEFAEVNQPLSGPAFEATYTNTPISAILTDSDGSPSEDVSLTPNHFISQNISGPNTFLKTNVGDTVTFTLTASDGSNINTSTAVITWTNYIYYGSGPPGQSSGSFISSLTGTLSNVQLDTFTVAAGVNEKVYFAHRTALPQITFVFNGFTGGFTVTGTTIPVTNNFGFTENYTLYESDNTNLGLITFDIF